MRAAHEFGDIPEIAIRLQPAVLYKLAAKSTPEQLRRDMIDEMKAGVEMSPEEISRRIRRARPRNRKEKGNVIEPEKTADEKANASTDVSDQEQDERWVTFAKKAVQILQKRLGTDFPKFRKVLGQLPMSAFLQALRDAEAASSAKKLDHRTRPDGVS